MSSLFGWNRPASAGMRTSNYCESNAHSSDAGQQIFDKPCPWTQGSQNPRRRVPAHASSTSIPPHFQLTGTFGSCLCCFRKVASHFKCVAHKLIYELPVRFTVLWVKFSVHDEDLPLCFIFSEQKGQVDRQGCLTRR